MCVCVLVVFLVVNEIYALVICVHPPFFYTVDEDDMS